jgi:Ni,Fe-hydrogenase III component G
MSREEELRDALIKGLNLTEEKVKVARTRRISLEVEYSAFEGALKFITAQLKFSRMPSITGLDEADKLSLVYVLENDEGIILSLKTSVAKDNPVIRSVTTQFPSADIYERELVDLFGFKVDGLARGNRYPLSDDWPADEHPLRKDWKPKGERS